MEPIAPLSKRPKFPQPFDTADAAANGNKFDELPESLVHHIFSFMETIDVMRASAVSTSWRYLWTSMSHLDFNYNASRLWSWYNYHKYKDFINWVLMNHDKSVSIESCRLSCLFNEGDNSVYRWLHFLANKRVQKLYLSLESDGENHFVWPCCLLTSDSLEVLEIDLQYCVLKIPSCGGFSQLKSLKLASIRLLDQNSFQNLISSCPLLENLSLNECLFHGCEVLDISFGNLRKLVIESEESEGLEECDLKITCPNLVYFDLTGPVQSLSWGEKPCFLQTAILNFYLDKVNDEFTKFVLEILKGVCHVEILKLCGNILEYISPAVAKPGCFSPTFYKLKTLKLSAGVEACYIQSIIYLLKCAPNLQFLSVDCEYNKYNYECKMLDEDIECLTCHLKMVKLIDANGNDADLELVRFFLKNARVLEKMSITWCPMPSWDTKRWDTKREIIQKYISPAVAKPGCFSTIFYKLKTLKLSTGVEACYIQSIIYLLKCAPNLQRLSIYFEYDKYIERDYECKMLGEDIECLTCHLKMVKLNYIGDSDAELELIRFFLRNARVLEKMSIIWCLWLNPETQREVTQKVMKFPRSSSHVNVTSMK